MLRALLLVEDEDVRCTILPELMTYDKGQLQERFIQLLQETWDADTLDEIVSVCEKIFSLTVGARSVAEGQLGVLILAGA